MGCARTCRRVPDSNGIWARRHKSRSSSSVVQVHVRHNDVFCVSGEASPTVMGHVPDETLAWAAQRRGIPTSSGVSDCCLSPSIRYGNEYFVPLSIKAYKKDTGMIHWRACIAQEG